ncbi:hypothetical protein BKA80DRAFT_308830 [Phyllosticta citrichinensis]
MGLPHRRRLRSFAEINQEAEPGDAGDDRMEIDDFNDIFSNNGDAAGTNNALLMPTNHAAPVRSERFYTLLKALRASSSRAISFRELTTASPATSSSTTPPTTRNTMRSSIPHLSHRDHGHQGMPPELHPLQPGQDIYSFSSDDDDTPAPAALLLPLFIPTPTQPAAAQPVATLTGASYAG